MKYLLFILFISIGTASYGQEIIPFPDLSENHETDYINSETIDDRNYALYTEDFQIALRKVDDDIEEINIELQSELIEERIDSLRNKKADLLKKKSALLEEAQLVDDLNKFY
jgi:hypothetical protein